MRILILINSFVYGIFMTSREKYNISFLQDEGVTRFALTTRVTILSSRSGQKIAIDPFPILAP